MKVTGVLSVFLPVAIFFGLSLPNYSDAANILALMGLPSPSHHHWAQHIFKRLTENGHNVTVLSPDPNKATIPNLHYILAEAVYPTLYASPEAINLTAFLDMNGFQTSAETWRFCHMTSEGFANSNGLQTLLKYPNTFKFDLVMLDFSCGPFLLGFLHKFKYPPMMGFTAFSVPPYVYDFVGGHKRMAYVVHYAANLDANHLSFTDRLLNHAIALFEDL